MFIKKNECYCCGQQLNRWSSYEESQPLQKRYCDQCNFKFREFIVLYSRLIELIIDFYFKDENPNPNQQQ